MVLAKSVCACCVVEIMLGWDECPGYWCGPEIGLGVWVVIRVSGYELTEKERISRSKVPGKLKDYGIW